MEGHKSSEMYLREFTEEVKKFEKYLSVYDHLPKNITLFSILSKNKKSTLRIFDDKTEWEFWYLTTSAYKVVLLRYLKTCDFDCEQAKDLLEYNLRFRQKHPHLFDNRDMFSKEMQTVVNTYQILQIQKFTKDNLHVTMSRVSDPDSTKFNLVDTVKWLFLMSDAGYTSDLGIPDGEIAVLDFKGFTWCHLMKVVGNISVLRAFLKYVQEAVPYRVVQNHYVNCSPVLTKLMTVIRPFVKKELFENMHFHTNNYETLYEFIPKELLPTEYGGSYGTVDEIYEDNLKYVYEKSEYVKQEENWKLLD